MFEQWHDRIVALSDALLYNKSIPKESQIMSDIYGEDETLATLRACLANEKLTLAISGPHTCLVSGSIFYEVHLAVEAREVHVRLEDHYLPRGFSYVMESGLGYAEELICRGLVRKVFPALDPVTELLEGLVKERRAEREPKNIGLDCPHTVHMDVVVRGAKLGRVVYYPHDGKRFSFYRLDRSQAIYEELGRRDNLQAAMDALLSEVVA